MPRFWVTMRPGPVTLPGKTSGGICFYNHFGYCVRASFFSDWYATEGLK